MRTTQAALGGALGAVLALGLSACGGGSGATPAAKPSTAAAAAGYCSLVKQSSSGLTPTPPTSLGTNPDAATLRTWIDSAVAPRLKRTAAIVADAPAEEKADWKALQKAQNGVVSGLRSLVRPQTFASWRRMSRQARTLRLVEVLLKPFASDKGLSSRIARDVKADCGVDIHG